MSWSVTWAQHSVVRVTRGHTQSGGPHGLLALQLLTGVDTWGFSPGSSSAGTADPHFPGRVTGQPPHVEETGHPRPSRTASVCLCRDPAQNVSVLQMNASCLYNLAGLSRLLRGVRTLREGEGFLGGQDQETTRGDGRPCCFSASPAPPASPGAPGLETACASVGLLEGMWEESQSHLNPAERAVDAGSRLIPPGGSERRVACCWDTERLPAPSGASSLQTRPSTGVGL